MTDKNTLYLARQWAADINADRQTLSQDTIDAAADLISSLPDEWVSSDELWEWVRFKRGRGIWSHSEANKARRELLAELEEEFLAPPTPRKTLADMTPEERAECQWMQAKDDVGNHVIITGLDEEAQEGRVLYENGDKYEWPYEILVPLPYLPRLEWPGNEPDDDESDFDPSYTYRDNHGDEWKLATKVGRWVCETRKGHTFHVEHDPPAEYGPYTRIEA